MDKEGIVFNDLIAQEMLLNNLLYHIWSAAMIPNSIRIND